MALRLRLRGKFGKGKYALVSDAKHPKCKRHIWWVRSADGYVATTIKGKVIELQNFVMDYEKNDEFLIDHINGNVLDNTDENLRIVTTQQNNFNTAVHKDNKSGLKGVSAFRGKWRVRISVDEKVHSIGVFDDPNLAAKAYDAAARYYFGEYARLNFPDDPNPPTYEEKYYE